MNIQNSLNIEIDGSVLVVDKPAGWTSFDVVNKIRRMTGIKKVGHAGTLDPFATGILLVCTGKATKKSAALMDLPKEYIAKIALGRETDTMDVTGETIAEKAVPPFDGEDVKAVLAQFVGVIEQEIPAYSAAKFKGKRLYKLAREGKAVPCLYKKVVISEIELMDFGNDILKIRVKCGKGTYIRTLARDIARNLNTAGYVKELVRTRVGDYELANAFTLITLEDLLQGNGTQ